LGITKIKTVLSLMLVVITILTALTTTTAVYAGGEDDDGGDGNKQKAEDDSAAAIADCDDNEVEEARFLCIALATNDVEIETQEEEPPEEESATLFVCKEVENPPPNIDRGDFEFVVTGPGVDIQFLGVPSNDPDADCPPGSSRPGEYVIMETDSSLIPDPDSIEVEGDCTQIDPPDEAIAAAATVEIQEGETRTLTCTFTNIYEGGDS
jgi:hypothetical protein